MNTITLQVFIDGLSKLNRNEIISIRDTINARLIKEAEIQERHERFTLVR